MLVNEQFKKYRENAISKMTAGELIVFLFEEAAVNLNKAILAINKKDVCAAHNCIIKAENIFLYLNETLDITYPISKELSTLYDYFYNCLVKANIKKDITIIEGVLKMSAELKDSWQKAEVLSRTTGKRR